MVSDQFRAAGFTVLVGLIIVFWEKLLLTLGSLGNKPLKSMTANPLIYLTLPNNQYLYFFMVMSFVVSVLICIIQVFKYVSGARSSGDLSSGQLIPWLVLGGLTLSGLTQIVPTWDPKHLWWAAPIGLLLLFSIVGVNSSLNRLSGNPLILPLLVTGAVAIFSASAYWGSERVQGKPGTIIDGMLVSKKAFNEINQDTAFLRAQLHGSESVIYLVDDGDLSVLDGRYRSADSYFVDWGGVPGIQTRIANGNPIVVQTSTFGRDNINNLARSIKYKVIASNQRLVLLRPVDTASG